MSTTTITNKQSTHPGRARSRRAPATRTTLASGQRQGAVAANERVADIVIRIPGAQDAQPLAQLAERAGADVPHGALMVAAHDAGLLAAVATGTGEALVDPSPAGVAAEGILRHRIA
ncbi:MAG TPA: hypothetical protein VGX51_02570, partial [Solirubrobacteraceae bacterium]|nr:hypothetical protein [Solirubrobacteraceae bacterium]